MSITVIIAAGTLAVWIYLIAGRGRFWKASVDRDGEPLPALSSWPSVVTVIPARDEAASIAQCLCSLRAQDYRGALRIVLVDDQSSDGTAAVAEASAEAAGRSKDLTIVSGRP